MKSRAVRGSIVLLALTALSCVSPSEKDKMQADIFDLKTKILTMEGQVKGQDSQTSNQSKTLANSGSRIEKMDLAMQRLRGDIDALRIGVVTGEMPGGSEGGSIAKTLADLSARVEKLEGNMQSLMAAVDNVSKRSVKPAPPAAAEGPAKTPHLNLAALQTAYKADRFKHVVVDGPELLKKASKPEEKAEILFMLAESLYKLGRLRDAALRYNDMIETGTKLNLAHAKMRMGDCFRHLGEKATAKLYYEELVDQFPSTGEAEKAKERLSKL